MMGAMFQVTVLAVGGTGESHPDDHRRHVSGLLRDVTDALDDRFVPRWVGYPASYGPVAAGGLSYRQSTEVGVRRLIDAMEDAPGPVMLIGYSQGCTVIREVLGQIATAPCAPATSPPWVSSPIPSNRREWLRGASGAVSRVSARRSPSRYRSSGSRTRTT